MPRKSNQILILTVLTLGVAGAGCRGEPGESALAKQIPAVDPAQERASAGGAAQSARLRRLWAGEQFSFYLSSPSPDGRYVTEIDWSTGNLAVRDLERADFTISPVDLCEDLGADLVQTKGVARSSCGDPGLRG